MAMTSATSFASSENALRASTTRIAFVEPIQHGTSVESGSTVRTRASVEVARGIAIAIRRTSMLRPAGRHVVARSAPPTVARWYRHR